MDNLWEKCEEPLTGRIYYFCKEMNVARWDLPKGVMKKSYPDTVRSRSGSNYTCFVCLELFAPLSHLCRPFPSFWRQGHRSVIRRLCSSPACCTTTTRTSPTSWTSTREISWRSSIWASPTGQEPPASRTAPTDTFPTATTPWSSRLETPSRGSRAPTEWAATIASEWASRRWTSSWAATPCRWTKTGSRMDHRNLLIL